MAVVKICRTPTGNISFLEPFTILEKRLEFCGAESPQLQYLSSQDIYAMTSNPIKDTKVIRSMAAVLPIGIS
jgi:hypothetical protein